MPCQITVPGHVLSAVEVCKEILFLIQTFNVVFFFLHLGIPCITDCVMAEIEKLGQRYRVALRYVQGVPLCFYNLVF